MCSSYFSFYCATHTNSLFALSRFISVFGHTNGSHTGSFLDRTRMPLQCTRKCVFLCMDGPSILPPLDLCTPDFSLAAFLQKSSFQMWHCEDSVLNGSKKYGPQAASGIIHFKASLNYKQGLLYRSPFVFLVQRELLSLAWLFTNTVEIMPKYTLPGFHNYHLYGHNIYGYLGIHLCIA